MGQLFGSIQHLPHPRRDGCHQLVLEPGVPLGLKLRQHLASDFDHDDPRFRSNDSHHRRYARFELRFGHGAFGVARGAALLVTSGQPVYQLGTFKVWGQGAVFGIPTPLLFVVGILAVTWYILNHTRLGRYIYAIGGNQEAARASGIAVNRVRVIAYLINGAFVGIAGVLYMSRVNAGLPDAGQGFDLDALTSSIIGGVSFSGGIGTAVGTLAGAFIVGFLGNIMNLLGIQSYVQQLIRGAIIALAVAYDIASNRAGHARFSAARPSARPNATM